jgi:hypothetical protein
MDQNQPATPAPATQPVAPQPATASQTPSTKSGSKSKLIIIIVAVLLLAGAAGGGYWYYMNMSKTEPVVQATPTPTIVQPLTLELESPTDGTIVEGSTLTVTGKTLPNTTVVFYTETAEGSAQSDASGNFSGTITLTNGINSLVVTAFGEDGEEKTVSVDVVFDEDTTTQ